MARGLRFVAWAFIAIAALDSVGTLGVMHLRIWHSDINHIGYDMAWNVPRFVAYMSIASVALYMYQERSRFISNLLWLVLAVSLTATFTSYLYSRNFVLADYDYWGSHGMPDRPAPWEGMFWRPLVPFIPNLPPDYWEKERERERLEQLTKEKGDTRQ